jgi:hypothetical protein
MWHCQRRAYPFFRLGATAQDVGGHDSTDERGLVLDVDILDVAGRGDGSDSLATGRILSGALVPQQGVLGQLFVVLGIREVIGAGLSTMVLVPMAAFGATLVFVKQGAFIGSERRQFL